MNMKILVTLFGIFLSIFCVREVNGGTAVKDEYFPHSAIRTVKTTSGDTYDCIDKLSQPGLQNPALVEKIKLGKNGTIHQSVGDVLPNGSSKNESKGFDLDKIWAGQRCPAGTVPIPQKTGKLQKFVFPPKALRQMASSDYNGGTQFVGIVVDEGELMGGHAEMTVWNPNPVSPGQYSAASIIIENGTEAIEAGWIVHPDLYQDTKTRLYTAWRNEKGGYYNTDYPGFVVVNEDIPLNYAFPRTSDTFGESDQVKITIQRGDEAGNWYLTVDDNILGFWRGELFQNLVYSATTVLFGGQIYSRPPSKDTPPMGSGRPFKNYNTGRACYMQNIQVLLDEFVPPPSYKKIENFLCYYAGGDHYTDEPYKRNVKGFHFWFGGQGRRDDTTCISPYD